MVGSEKREKSRCEVCLNIQETATFTSTAAGESFKINHTLNCDSNCLTYLLTCKCCGKQYVGETTDEFRLRWNCYKSNDRENASNEACMQVLLFEHFKSEGRSGFLGNFSITFIDKADGKDFSDIAYMFFICIYKYIYMYVYIYIHIYIYIYMYIYI